MKHEIKFSDEDRPRVDKLITVLHRFVKVLEKLFGMNNGE